MGYMERCMWNSFHVLYNMSYFTYVNLMEDFPQNSPSIICSFMYLSSVDHLVYRELPMLYNLVINGRVGIILAALWTMTHGWVILSVNPHQLPPCPCVVCQSIKFFFFFLILNFQIFEFLNFVFDCWHVAQSSGLSIMSFHPLRKAPSVFFWLVASFPMTSFVAYK